MTNPSKEEKVDKPTKVGMLPELVEALRGLLWPNVPSHSDVAMLIRGLGGSQERMGKAMELAEKLGKAQDAAHDLLKRYEEADNA